MFFSTHGVRSTADEASGGDFDGDLYKVIYNRDVVEKTYKDWPAYIAPVSSAVAPTVASSASACTSAVTPHSTPHRQAAAGGKPHHRDLRTDFSPERRGPLPLSLPNPFSSPPKRDRDTTPTPTYTPAHATSYENDSSYRDTQCDSIGKPYCPSEWTTATTSANTSASSSASTTASTTISEYSRGVLSRPVKSRSLSSPYPYPPPVTPIHRSTSEYTPTPSKAPKCDVFGSRSAQRHSSPYGSERTNLTPNFESTTINCNNSHNSGSSSSSSSSFDPYEDPIGWDIIQGVSHEILLVGRKDT